MCRAYRRILGLVLLTALEICTCATLGLEDGAKIDNSTSLNDTKSTGGLEKFATNQTMKGDESLLMMKTRWARAQRGCGLSTYDRVRIVGGRPADPAAWPWMAALLRQNSQYYCGGVLITDRHVLTAAHCIHKLKRREVKVRLGEYDFSKPNRRRALDFTVTDIRAHDGFDPMTYENDIAILKIHRPTQFTDYIWPICLPPIDQNFENKSAIITGWGTQYYGGPASNVLMEVRVPVWPQSLCISKVSLPIRENQICAGAFNGGRDACQGDSGGPLLHQLGNGRWVNIGIVSWGLRCGEPQQPGIYTRVSTYLDWIFANAIF